MILLIVVIVFVDLVISVENVGAFDFFKSLIGKNENFNINYIVFQVRLPRVFTAILVGAGLSVAGLLLQTLFHNPLAGPFVLGISSGASLGVAVFIMAAGAGMGISPFFTAGGQVLAALIGSGLVFILVLLFSWKLNDTVSLLIIGIMIGSLASSVVSILQYFANPETVHKFVIWSLGSLSSTSWVHLKFIFPVFALSLLLLIFILKPLDIMLMGEVHARVSGVNVRLVRILMIIIASLLAGTLTAFTGPIGFIGMTVPHLARLITRSISHRVIVPGVIVTGSLLMLICDIISQMPGRASVLPINAVTALFGAPVVVGFIVRNRKTKII
ncbi:MAG: iron ABC transporter permease [Bacteroidales bacterium]|nr:iron ABC transporter permease [Bacteroidales bacterium]